MVFILGCYLELSNHLCKPLTRLFNNSLAVGELPKEWKQRRISAIFKKGNKKILDESV